MFINSNNITESMGNCATQSQIINRKHYENPPVDFHKHDRNNPDRKIYNCILSNIRIQNLCDALLGTEFSIQFNIDQTCQAQFFSQRNAESKLEWNTLKLFKLFYNDYEIRTKNLKVSLKNRENNKSHELKINLFQILSGPFHHDFEISRKGKSIGRLIFDLRISEIIDVSLQAITSLVTLNEEYPGETFNFVIQSHSNNGSYASESNRSRQKNQNKSIPSYKKCLAMDPSEKKEEKFAVLKWTQLQNSQMPSLNLKIGSSDILSTILMVKVQKFYDSRKFTEFGHISFSISELISKQDYKQLHQTSNYVQQLKRIEKNLIGDGYVLGKCEVQIKINFKRFVHQIANCSQTQDGVISMNYNQFYKMRINSSQNQFQQIEDSLQDIVALTQQKIGCTSFYVRSGIDSQINDQLKKINKCLEDSLKQSFVYEDRRSKKLRDRKKLLMKILSILACLIQQNGTELGQQSWSTVITIMKRGQMTVNNWELNQTSILTKQLNNNSQLQIAIQYAQTMIKLLKLVLNSSQQTILQNQNQYQEIFKAFCFFRIPIFKNLFLQKLTTQLYQETSGTDTNKYKINGDKGVLGVLSEETPEDIDWEGRFWKWLKFTKNGNFICEDLRVCLQNHQWFSQLLNQNQSYFGFFMVIMTKFISLKQRLKLPKWTFFEGYSLLVQKLLLTISKKQLSTFSNTALKSTILLLQNEKLCPIILNILYSKSNVHDQSSMFRLTYILSHFLHALSKNNNNLKHFPYSLMMKPLKYILESDHCVSISYFLTFLYTFYGKFQASFRYQLACYLIGKLIWRFAFSWSYHIRRIFYHFIVLKISQDQQIIQSTEIWDRLSNVSKILIVIQKRSLRKQIKGQSEPVNQLHVLMKMRLKQRKTQCMNNHNKKTKQFQNLNLTQLMKTKAEGQTIFINYNNKFPTLSFFRKASEQRQTEDAFHLQNRDTNIGQPQMPLLKLKKKQTYLYHKFTHSCFNQMDFMIPQIDQKIQHHVQKYSKISIRQLRNLLKFTEEHFELKQALPNIEFQYKVQIDQRDLRPDHIEHFQ